jgi:hypothetical protein
VKDDALGRAGGAETAVGGAEAVEQAAQALRLGQAGRAVGALEEHARHVWVAGDALQRGVDRFQAERRRVHGQERVVPGCVGRALQQVALQPEDGVGGEAAQEEPAAQVAARAEQALPGEDDEVKDLCVPGEFGG